VNGTRTCTISDCSGRVIGRGYCSKHYQRELKYGDPHYTKNAYASGSPDGNRAKRGATVTERLARYGKPDGKCVVWDGARTPFGYGLINIGGRMEGVHRAMWFENHGEIPAGMVVRHKCDNPPCFRIDHLELGSRADNMRDWLDRGRWAS